jgi:hypothetical protein
MIVRDDRQVLEKQSKKDSKNKDGDEKDIER